MMMDRGELIELTQDRCENYGMLSRLFRVEIDRALLEDLVDSPAAEPIGNRDFDEGYARLRAQLDAIEDALAEKDSLCNEQKQTIADLQAKLDKQPAESTKQVVEDRKPGGDPAPKNDVEQFVDTYNSARALYNEV